MMKKKQGRPSLKKIIDSFVELKKKDVPVVVPVVDPVPLCDCGKPMHANHRPQCWDCSHRS